MTGTNALVFGVFSVILNLLIAATYYARKKYPGFVQTLRNIFIMLIIPFGYLLTWNLLEGKNIFIRVCLAVVVAFILNQWMLNRQVKTKSEFERMHLFSYHILEFVAFFSLIYIAFTVSSFWGWMISITFWIASAAIIYFYAGKKKKK